MGVFNNTFGEALVHLGANVNYDIEPTVFLKAAGISKTILLDNTENKEALPGYTHEVTLSATDFSTSGTYAANKIIFSDGTNNLPYYIKEFSSTVLKAYIKVDIAANSSKQIVLQSATEKTNCQSFKGICRRKGIANTTVNLYTFNTVKDAKGIGNDLVLTNATLISNEYGNVLDCNGNTAFATITKDFPSTNYDIKHLRFNFVLKTDHAAGSGIKCILSKYHATNPFYVRLLNDGSLEVYIGASYYFLENAVKKTSWSKNTVYSFDLRVSKAYMVCHVNDVYLKLSELYVLPGPPITTPDLDHFPVTGDFVFGAYNNGTPAQFADIQVFDFEISEGREEIGYASARNKCIQQSKINEVNKWEYITCLPSELDGHFRQEPNILTVNGKLYLYGTDNSVGSGQSLQISEDDGVTWSLPQPVLYGFRAFYFWYNSKIYRLYRIASPVDTLYIAESTDGITFTNVQTFLVADGAYGMETLENSCIYLHSDGKWYGIVEAHTPSGWQSFVIKGDNLNSVSVVAGPISGSYNSGAFLHYLDGKWQKWAHSGNSNPSQVTRHTNTNILTDTWLKVYTNDIFTINQKAAQEHIADISFCEKDGVTYAAIDNSIETMETNGSYSIYKYNGTILQLIGDLAVTTFGKNLLANSGFDTDTSWIKQGGANANISGGKLNISKPANVDGGAYQEIGAKQNTNYRIKFDAVRISGTSVVYFGGGGGGYVTVSVSQSYSGIINSGTTNGNLLVGSWDLAFVGSFDNVTVEEVL